MCKDEDTLARRLVRWAHSHPVLAVVIALAWTALAAWGFRDIVTRLDTLLSGLG